MCILIYIYINVCIYIYIYICIYIYIYIYKQTSQHDVLISLYSHYGYNYGYNDKQLVSTVAIKQVLFFYQRDRDRIPWIIHLRNIEFPFIFW